MSGVDGAVRTGSATGGGAAGLAAGRLGMIDPEGAGAGAAAGRFGAAAGALGATDGSDGENVGWGAAAGTS